MKIRSRLRLNTFISLSTVILILLSLTWSWRQMLVADRNMAQIVGMRKIAFERILFRDEYILFQEERSGKQWYAKSEELGKLLAGAEQYFDQQGDRTLLQEAQKNFEATLAGFSRIIDNNKRKDTDTHTMASYSEAELRQISQVFQNAYSLTDNINRLYESAQIRTENVRNNGVYIVVVFIFAGIMAIIINSAVIRRTLAKRITALDKGVKIIGAGNLDYRIAVEGDDELTALALASNNMAIQLKKTYTSVDNLEKQIAERKKAEEALLESEEKLREAQQMAQLGNWIWDVKTGSVEWSEEVYKIFHLAPNDFTPQIDSIMTLSPWPDEHERDKELLRKATESREKGEYEQRFLYPDGSSGYYYSTFQGKYDEGGNLIAIIGTIQDITDRKRLDLKLKESLIDLQRSNKELEQFAYVASHDLQEPLRMISSYTQLLADRYQDKLDDKANLFIHYAVNGAVRMQLLINDLLAYSRIGTKGKPLEMVDACAMLGKALSNLNMSIEESKAIITNDHLPAVNADPSQLVQLFQNLIGNGVKFRGENYPHIHISAQDKGNEWLFSVKDNGVGIDPQFADKIFVIFQRLHTKEEYPGSGIGLAICKKIVERHNGKIWFESEPGNGTTFYFTIHK